VILLDRTFERGLPIPALVRAGDLLTILLEGDERPAGADGQFHAELPLTGDGRGRCRQENDADEKDKGGRR
jgi:hypothetical protein